MYRDSYHRSDSAQQSPFLQMLLHGFPFGRVFGIDIRIHFVLIVMLLVVFMYQLTNSHMPFGIRLLLALLHPILVYGSVLFHELGHCYGAYLVGGVARSILLWPLGGLASIEGSNRTPKTELVVVAFGPFASLLLALIATAFHVMVPTAGPQGNVFFDLLDYTLWFLVGINWMLCLFNLLVPIFPLDSAVLLRALFSLRYPAEKVTYYVCIAGIWIAAVVFAVGILTPHLFSQILVLIALFGGFSCWQMLQMLPHAQIYLTEPWAYGYQQTIQSPWIPPRWSRRRLRHGRRASKPAPEQQRGPAVVVPLSRVETLRQQMQDAVAREDYQQAARLRDEIRRLQETGE